MLIQGHIKGDGGSNLAITIYKITLTLHYFHPGLEQVNTRITVKTKTLQLKKGADKHMLTVDIVMVCFPQ